MKVIDLYKLIANKEYDKLPQKIMLKDYNYIFSLREDWTGYKWYGEVNTHDDFEETIHQNLEFILNCEITILDKIEENKIEEKKIPEKLNEDFNQHCNEYLYKKVEDKVNEIIDFLKSKGE